MGIKKFPFFSVLKPGFSGHPNFEGWCDTVLRCVGSMLRLLFLMMIMIMFFLYSVPWTPWKTINVSPNKKKWWRDLNKWLNVIKIKEWLLSRVFFKPRCAVNLWRHMDILRTLLATLLPNARVCKQINKLIFLFRFCQKYFPTFNTLRFFEFLFSKTLPSLNLLEKIKGSASLPKESR